MPSANYIAYWDEQIRLAEGGAPIVPEEAAPDVPERDFQSITGPGRPGPDITSTDALEGVDLGASEAGTGTITADEIEGAVETNVPDIVTEQDLTYEEMIFDNGVWRIPELGERPSALVAYDAAGNPTIIEDYTQFNTLLNDIATMTPRTIEQFMTENNLSFAPLPDSPDLGAIDPLFGKSADALSKIAEAAASGATPEQLQQMKEEAAALFGLSPEEFDARLNTIQNQIAGGPDAFSGFSAETSKLNEASLQSQLRMQADTFTRLVESVGASTGSATRQLATADSAMRQMRDFELQTRVANANREAELQMEQFRQAQDQLIQMVQARQMSYEEFFDRTATERDQAIQAYASVMDEIRESRNSEIQALIQQYNGDVNAAYQANQQIFDLYQADQDAFDQTFRATMDAFNIEAGLHDIATQDQQNYVDQVMTIFNSRLESATGLLSLDELLADPTIMEQFGGGAEIIVNIIGIIISLFI